MPWVDEIGLDRMGGPKVAGYSSSSALKSLDSGRAILVNNVGS